MYEQEKDKCILALRNIPKGSEIGIDYHSWYTGERFKGISNIPAGFHFVFIRVVDKYGEMAPRSGFFIFLHPGETVCKSFEQENEEFETLEEIISFEEMKETLTQMAPYPDKECKLWPQLTCHVGSSVYERLQPSSKRVCSYTEVAFNKSDLRTGRIRRMLLKSDTRTAQLANSLEENYINFTKIPTVKCDTPSELSRNSLDTSVCLEQLIANISEGNQGLLGEMQFAFITFLIGQVYDAFEHWKEVLSLICGCLDSVSKLSEFYEQFIDVIGLQLDELPVDFFLNIIPQKNVVYILFQEFFQNINETHGSGLTSKFIWKISILKEKLFRRFQWEFDDVIEDEMPAIVE